MVVAGLLSAMPGILVVNRPDVPVIVLAGVNAFTPTFTPDDPTVVAPLCFIFRAAIARGLCNYTANQQYFSVDTDAGRYAFPTQQPLIRPMVISIPIVS